MGVNRIRYGRDDGGHIDPWIVADRAVDAISNCDAMTRRLIGRESPSLAAIASATAIDKWRIGIPDRPGYGVAFNWVVFP
jgi:hypothetical protein